MPDLITPDEISTLTGVTFDGDDEDLVTLLILFAVGEIETWLGRPVSIQSFMEYVRPDSEGRVYLEKTPVVEVESVTLDGVGITSNYYGVTTWGLEYWDYAYSFTDIYTDDYLNTALLVEYRAGLDTPMAVNSVIAAGVANAYTDKKTKAKIAASGHAGVKELTVEDYTVKYEGSAAAKTAYAAGATPLTIFASEADFFTIKRLKKRTIVT